MSKKDFINLIKEEISFLENEKICEYNSKESYMPMLPLSKWGRAISEQEARIDVLKKILTKLEKNG
jgi:hypothetical protein